MADSIVKYVADGSTSEFSITFPYINRADVTVLVSGVAAAHTFLNDTTITLTSTPRNQRDCCYKTANFEGAVGRFHRWFNTI